MRRHRRAVLPLALLLAGAASSTHGAWIFAKAQLAQLLLDRAWRQTAAEGPGVAPWPWADTWPVARLSAPACGIDLVVLAGGSGRTLAFGPGHLDGSADPGALGNCVIAGHRDTHFAFLERLAVGDELVLATPGGPALSYRVTATDVVDRSDVWVMAPSGGRELTLVTCYPFRDPIPGGPLRYVVRASSRAPDGLCLAIQNRWSTMGARGRELSQARSPAAARRRGDENRARVRTPG